MEKVEIKDLYEFKFLSGMEKSKDDKLIAFEVARALEDDNGYKTNIYLLDVKKNEISKLTGSDDHISFWLDKNNLVFSSKRDAKKDEEDFPKSKFFHIDVRGGEGEEFLEIPLPVGSIRDLGKDSYLISYRDDTNYKDVSELGDEEKKALAKEIKDNKDFEVLEEIPFWLNGGGFTSKKRSRLAIYNAKKKAITNLTERESSYNILDLSEDKKFALAMKKTNTGRMSVFSKLTIIDLKTKEVKEIGFDTDFAYYGARFLEDRIIFFGHDGKKTGINEDPKFYSMKLDGTDIKKLTDQVNMGYGVNTDVILAGSETIKVVGDRLYYASGVGFNQNLYSISLKGDIREELTVSGSIEGYEVIGDTIYFLGMLDSRLMEIYKYEKGEITQISKLNEDYYKSHYIQKPEHFTFKSNGATLDGFVIYPVNYEKGKKYPGLLEIHGGPKTAYGTVFFHEMQVFASQGYFVFFTNPHGSDGRGDAFSDIRGKYGTIDYEDLMNFTDVVLEKFPDIDGERLGTLGGSYGGFMVNWIIGHTDRFKAACSQRSIANWISKFGTTDIGYYFVDDQQAATPWSDPEKLWFHSPMKYADKAKTPTLFIHSEEDYRCWLPEGIQMFTALKYFGVKAKLVMFRGETHELSRSGKPKSRVRRLKEMLDWFEGELK
ncbi:MAG: S9 family peptidase [Tissierellia bacterium]|nr:S9 family peptidase [Tissierellia bacterium]